MGYFSDFKKALLNNVKDITALDGQHVIFSFSNGAEPEGEYCQIHFMQVDQIGSHKTSTLADTSEQLWLRNEYEVRTKFSFYGEDSDDLCASFAHAMNNAVYLENLLRDNISVMRQGVSSFVPDKRQERYVNRWTLEVVYAFAVYTQHDIDVIDEIQITDLLGKTYTIP